MSKNLAQRICNYWISFQLYTNNISRCLGIVVLLPVRIQYHQFMTFMSSLLSYKYIIYRSPNKPKQYKLLTIYPSTNTRSGSTAYKETLDNFPPTSPTSPYLSKYDLDSIQNYIKSMTYKHHYDMKYLKYHISDMLSNLSDTISKTDKQ